MKINIADPLTGQQKVIEIEDDAKLRPLYEKRISHEVDGDTLGDEFKGYVFRISGGNDKQGFPMLQGVLTAQRVRLLFSKGMKCYRERKAGERKRKSVRGCVVSGELSVVNLVIVKKGAAEIPGLTDTQKPRRLGPKRATKIRRLFNLTKEDDVRSYVIRRKIIPKAPAPKEGEEGEGKEAAAAPVKAKKPYSKAPRIQRLVTPQRLQRKREMKALKRHRWEKSRKEAEEYTALLSQRMKERRALRESKLAKKRSVSRLQAPQEGAAAPAKKEGTQAPTPTPAPAAASGAAVAAAKKPAPKPAAGKQKQAAPTEKPAAAAEGKGAKAEAHAKGKGEAKKGEAKGKGEAKAKVEPKAKAKAKDEGKGKPAGPAPAAPAPAPASAPAGQQQPKKEEPKKKQEPKKEKDGKDKKAKK